MRPDPLTLLVYGLFATCMLRAAISPTPSLGALSSPFLVTLQLGAPSTLAVNTALDNAATAVRLAQGEQKAIAEYVHTYAPAVDAPAVAMLLWDAAYRNGVDPWVLVYIARYESTFDIYSRNRKTGCAGLLQINPCHRRNMQNMGLQFDDIEDCLDFGCMLYKAQGLGPWQVRRKVRAEMKRNGRDL